MPEMAPSRAMETTNDAKALEKHIMDGVLSGIETIEEDGQILQKIYSIGYKKANRILQKNTGMRD